MPMKKIVSIFLLSLSLALVVGCSQEDTVLPDQQKKLESFLTSAHEPKLIAEANKTAGDQLPYYSVSGDRVYRYIFDVYNPERTGKALVEYGDNVSITFRMYVFDYKNITDKIMPYFSNDPLLKEAYEAVGLNTEFWSFEPMVVTLGETQILKGLELALAGCRDGDIVEAYMSYNMAYGTKPMGIIAKESPVAILFTINAVKKN